MLSDEEKKAIDELKEEINKPVEVPEDRFNTFILYNIESAKIVLNLIEKQSKEIEELKEVKWYYEISRVPKDKIKAKIEELKQKKYILSSRESEIEILKSLLEKE